MRIVRSARLARSLQVILLLALVLQPAAGRAQDLPQMGYDGLMDFVIAHQGKVVLVNFWATWCGPCIKEMPGLMQLREEISQESLVMINVSLDYDAKAVVKYIEKKKLNFPNYIASPDLMELLEIRAIPKMLLYDVDGMEVVSHEGYVPIEDLRPTIVELLPSQ